MTSVLLESGFILPDIVLAYHRVVVSVALANWTQFLSDYGGLGNLVDIDRDRPLSHCSSPLLTIHASHTEPFLRQNPPCSLPSFNPAPHLHRWQNPPLSSTLFPTPTASSLSALSSLCSPSPPLLFMPLPYLSITPASHLKAPSRPHTTPLSS